MRRAIRSHIAVPIYPLSCLSQSRYDGALRLTISDSARVSIVLLRAIT
jgi:hypothetical protein